jgi:hypothetical protein
LLLHRRAIARAALGELPVGDEEKLRAHLRGCAPCRDHYDALAGAAGAVSGGAAAAARERARLFAAVDAPRAAGGAAPRSGRRGWAWAGMVLAPAAALVLWLARPAPESAPAGEVTMRGGGASEARVAPAPATLVMYATRKTGPTSHGPVRLVGELPGSGEARVSLGDYLQLGVRGLRAPAHVRVVGLDETGTVHDYVPDTALAPTGAPLTLGGSVELARDHAPGRLRLVALFSEQKVDEAAVRAALARLDPRRVDRGATTESDATVVTGLLVIER